MAATGDKVGATRDNLSAIGLSQEENGAIY